jgi:hypothetical protein
MGEDTDFCKICGYILKIRGNVICFITKRKLLREGRLNVIYKGIETNSGGKPLLCPVCKNEEIKDDGDHCKICGLYLINKCTYDECYNGEICDSNARFCHICGYKTTYFYKGFLQAWDNREPVIPQPFFEGDDLPF